MSREDGIYQITEQLKKEAAVLGQHLALENKIREESVNKIQSMTHEIFGQLRNQLKVASAQQEEQHEREQNNESILRLVEEMCNRLDRKVSSY